MSEFCICSAILLINGEIIRGHRHNHCFDVARERDIPRESIIGAEQGFITSLGRFVNRKEAMDIQRKSDKPSNYGPSGEYIGDILFSEDLY